jgi:hypothetical protein
MIMHGYQLGGPYLCEAIHTKLKLTRFRGHPNICVQGAHDGEDESTLHTGIPSPDGRVGPCRPLTGGAGAGVRTRRRSRSETGLAKPSAMPAVAATG